MYSTYVCTINFTYTHIRREEHVSTAPKHETRHHKLLFELRWGGGGVGWDGLRWGKMGHADDVHFNVTCLK